MTTRTSTGKGLPKPHKAMKPAMGNGRGLENARSVSSSEKTMNKKMGSGGVAHTYYANSRACNSSEK
jgi:hypothetical protein